MKKVVEIEDCLNETVEMVKEEIRDNFIDYLKDNPSIAEFDDYYQAQGCDAVHQIVDSSTPIYNKTINDLYYLYGDEFEESYINAGIGNGNEDNHRQVTIYCYLSEKGFDYLGDLEKLFDEYNENKDIKGLIKSLKGNN